LSTVFELISNKLHIKNEFCFHIFEIEKIHWVTLLLVQIWMNVEIYPWIESLFISNTFIVKMDLNEIDIQLWSLDRYWKIEFQLLVKSLILIVKSRNLIFANNQNLKLELYSNKSKELHFNYAPALLLNMNNTKALLEKNQWLLSNSFNIKYIGKTWSQNSSN